MVHTLSSDKLRRGKPTRKFVKILDMHPSKVVVEEENLTT